MDTEQREKCVRASCMSVAYLVKPERRANKPDGMETFSEPAVFHRMKNLFWCIAEPEMAPFLTVEQSEALTEFERVYRSLPWRVIDGHPHISELPDDDLSPLVPAAERLYELIRPHRHATPVA